MSCRATPQSARDRNRRRIGRSNVPPLSLAEAPVAGFYVAIPAFRLLDRLRKGVGVQLRDLRELLNKDLDGIHQELRALSDQRIRMEAAEKGLAAQDGRNAAQDDRISALERQLIELRAELNSVTQASRVRLPGK